MAEAERISGPNWQPTDRNWLKKREKQPNGWSFAGGFSSRQQTTNGIPNWRVAAHRFPHFPALCVGLSSMQMKQQRG